MTGAFQTLNKELRKDLGDTDVCVSFFPLECYVDEFGGRKRVWGKKKGNVARATNAQRVFQASGGGRRGAALLQLGDDALAGVCEGDPGVGCTRGLTPACQSHHHFSVL